MYTAVLRIPADHDTMTFRGWSTLDTARTWLREKVRAHGSAYGWIIDDSTDTVVEEILPWG